MYIPDIPDFWSRDENKIKEEIIDNGVLQLLKWYIFLVDVWWIFV